MTEDDVRRIIREELDREGIIPIKVIGEISLPNLSENHVWLDEPGLTYVSRGASHVPD